MSAFPPSPDKDVREYWIKQSELLQGVVDRMANNSLEVKKFGVTVWTAITGFGVTNGNDWFFALSLASLIVFGVLDLYYLFLERKFRKNYNRLVRIIGGYGAVADEQWVVDIQGTFMRPDSSPKFLAGLPSVLRSWANLPYLIMFAVTIALFFVEFPMAE